MTHRRMLAPLLLAAGIASSAQTPLFTDGTAFGGSRVFPEGISPLGNPALYGSHAERQGAYLTYLKGEQRSKDNASAMDGLAQPTPDAAILKLADSPWGTSTQAYGIASVGKGFHTSYTHEDLRSLYAYPDGDTAHLGAGLPLNTTWADLRRSVVDRLTLGGASTGQDTQMGISLRVERWKTGTQAAPLNPDLAAGFDPLSISDTSERTLTCAVDLGFSTTLAQGIRLGGTVDRLNAKRLWDVEEKPQGRLGLQIDVGTLAQLSVETDVNAAMRMPFPVDQRTSAASLRVNANPTLTFILGAERRKIGDAAVTRGGVTLQIRTSRFLLGLGMQVGQDSPLRGASLMVN